MPDEKTHGDSVRWYLSGATFDGEEQLDPNLSLGNYRSSTEVREIGFEPFSMLSGLTIERVSGGVGPGGAVLRGLPPNRLRFKAPGGDYGNTVEIGVGETKVVEDRYRETAFLRVRRWGTTDLDGSTLLRCARRYGNAIGMSDISDAERAAGVEKVRAIVAKVESSSSVEVEIWIRPLADPVVSDQDYLPATGTGTIETSEDLSLFRPFGFARVETSVGALREIVFYSGDLSNGKLNVVDSAHRGLLGTTPSAGAFDDVIYPVPGLRISGEPPVGGKFEEVPNENTLPTGPFISWRSGISPTPGESVQFGGMAPGEIKALWIRLTLPPIAGSTYMSDVEALNSLEYSLLSNG